MEPGQGVVPAGVVNFRRGRRRRGVPGAAVHDLRQPRPIATQFPRDRAARGDPVQGVLRRFAGRQGPHRRAAAAGRLAAAAEGPEPADDGVDGAGGPRAPRPRDAAGRGPRAVREESRGPGTVGAARGDAPGLPGRQGLADGAGITFKDDQRGAGRDGSGPGAALVGVGPLGGPRRRRRFRSGRAARADARRGLARGLGRPAGHVLGGHGAARAGLQDEAGEDE
mmetsp:Transcript_1537/g.4239  ORF Transcript_1537/g.4239 Transcript_1537/m.4239 type:complete len:224 (-) Transcript_1537:26-697(-)